MKPRIRGVVFDCFGVLTTSPFEAVNGYEADKGYPQGSLVRLLLGDYDDHAGNQPWHRLERGEISATEFWKDFQAEAEKQGFDVEPSSFVSHLAKVTVREDVLATAIRIRTCYRTAVLSNNIKEFGDMWRRMIGAAENFDVVLDSSSIGLRKPDPEIFRYACRALGVEPGEAVFLDDSAANVDGACRAGMVGIVVRRPGDAIAELRSLLERHGEAGWPP